MLRLRKPGMLLFHQTRSSPWIPTLTPATQADITNPSQISCSTDQEASGFPPELQVASACGSEQCMDLPTLMVAEWGSSVASLAPGSGKASPRGLRASDGPLRVLQARERDQQSGGQHQAPHLSPEAGPGSGPLRGLLPHRPSCHQKLWPREGQDWFVGGVSFSLWLALPQ